MTIGIIVIITVAILVVAVIALFILWRHDRLRIVDLERTRNYSISIEYRNKIAYLERTCKYLEDRITDFVNDRQVERIVAIKDTITPPVIPVVNNIKAAQKETNNKTGGRKKK